MHINLSEEERKLQEEGYKQHLARKEVTRKDRYEEKEMVKENPEILAFNFDLQAVLTTSKGNAGPLI